MFTGAVAVVGSSLLFCCYFALVTGLLRPTSERRAPCGSVNALSGILDNGVFAVKFTPRVLEWERSDGRFILSNMCTFLLGLVFDFPFEPGEFDDASCGPSTDDLSSLDVVLTVGSVGCDTAYFMLRSPSSSWLFWLRFDLGDAAVCWALIAMCLFGEVCMRF